MGKNSDIRSISNILGKTILHGIVSEYTNRPESTSHLKSEFYEYCGQSIKKIDKRKLNDEGRMKIRKLVITIIKNKLKTKYSDVKVSEKIIEKRTDDYLQCLL